MKRTLASLALIVSSVLLCGADWHQFRGSHSNSVAQGSLPLNWNETENVAWKVELPGRGPSSPIVVGDRVVVTCSGGVEQDRAERQERLHVLCFDAGTGRELWQRQFWATGRTQTHPVSANAAPTPASDGQRIFAFFSSSDLICLDLEGNLQWYRGLALDYPKAGNDVGMSSSPVVIDDTVVVQIESQGDSFAAGLATDNGENRWRLDRQRQANWASPIALTPAEGKAAVLLQSPSGLSAHDPRTGGELWRYAGACSGIPSSVAQGSRVYVPSKGLTVLDVSSQGAGPQVVWESNRLNPSSASPIVHQGRVYAANRGGVLTCADAETGEMLWQLRLKGTLWATPVIAGGHMYCINQDGLAQVLKLGDDQAEVVATAEFGEGVQGSPAVADGAMYVRSDQHLWKIGGK